VVSIGEVSKCAGVCFYGPARVSGNKGLKSNAEEQKAAEREIKEGTV
jgi:hypothetical protein